MGEIPQRARDALAIGYDLGIAVGAVIPLVHVGHPHGSVEEAVIAAFDQQVAVAAGVRAGQPQRRHDGFGAGIGEAHEFGGGHHLRNAVGDDQLAFGRQREDAAHLHAAPCSGIDAIIRIAKDRRAIAEAIVDVAVAVDVPGASALAVIDVDGAVVAPVAEGGRDAERQALHRALILGVRLGEIAPGLAGHDRTLIVPPASGFTGF